MRTTDQARLLGLRETTTSPPSSTATHKLTDGQDTLNADLTPSEYTTLHDEAGPAGLVETITPPASSTATHNLTDGQDTPSSSPGVANGRR